ncbi:MAG: hypothetical protein QW159_01245 [Desulfurococcaceae archaeon]
MRLSLLLFMDNVAKQSRLIMIGNKVYIEKTYSAEPGIIKWYLVSVSNLAVGVYPFKLKPHERLENEVEFMRSKNTCFNKPEVVLVDYINLKLIREFVKGKVYNLQAPPLIHYLIAREIGKCHERGWAFGDSKITNFLYEGENLYVVDAEQATSSGKVEYYAWDLLVLVSTLLIDGYIKALFSEADREKAFENIIRGYLEGNSNGLEVLKLLKTTQFKTLLYLLIPFPLSYMFYRKIEEHLSQNSSSTS